MRTHPSTSLRAVGALVLASLMLAACGGDEPASIGQGGKVTVAGDSISVGIGAALRTAASGQREVKVIGVPGTGLAREDSFDWPTRLEELARDFPPEVLVLSLGSNDAQDLVDPDGSVAALLSDDEAWDREYSARLARSFDAFEDTDTTVVWLGHVRTAEDRVGLRNRRVHELATEVAKDRDWVVVEDLAEILGAGEEVATDCLVPDGVHLSVECYDRVAAYLLDTPPIG